MSDSADYINGRADGFREGWNSRAEYIRDYRNAHSGTGLGIVLMIVSVTTLLCIVGLAFFAPVHNIGALQISAIFAVVGIAGYFVNRFESKSYNKRLTEFREKWGE